MKSQVKWIFVLIGNDKTGKTTFQKHLVKMLSGECRDARLDCNLFLQINHPNFIRKIETLSVGNRSIQERIPDAYLSIDDYFDNHFKDADLCIIATHISEKDVVDILANCHKRFYNVCGVFFTNSISQDRAGNAEISKLNWDERWQVINPHTEIESEQTSQLKNAAASFVQILIDRVQSW